MHSRLTGYSQFCSGPFLSRLVPAIALGAATLLLGSLGTVGAKAETAFGPEALLAYCRGMERYDALHKEADQRFGIVGTSEKLDWIKERDAANTERMAEEIGAPAIDWLFLASNENWSQHCEAMKRGWTAIGEAELAAATRADAEMLEEALTLAYIAIINEGARAPSRSEPYRAVLCNSALVSDLWVIGCRLAGGSIFNSFKSQTYIYLAARHDDVPHFVPLKHAVDHVDHSRYTDADGNPARPGWYVGPLPLELDFLAAAEVVN